MIVRLSRCDTTREQSQVRETVGGTFTCSVRRVMTNSDARLFAFFECTTGRPVTEGSLVSCVIGIEERMKPDDLVFHIMFATTVEPYRGKGLMTLLLGHVKRHYHDTIAHAQPTAVPFWRKHSYREMTTRPDARTKVKGAVPMEYTGRKAVGKASVGITVLGIE